MEYFGILAKIFPLGSRGLKIISERKQISWPVKVWQKRFENPSRWRRGKPRRRWRTYANWGGHARRFGHDRGTLHSHGNHCQCHKWGGLEWAKIKPVQVSKIVNIIFIDIAIEVKNRGEDCAIKILGARKGSTGFAPMMTPHLNTHCWLVESFA